MKLSRIICWGVFSLCIGLGCYGLIYHQLHNHVTTDVNYPLSQGISEIGGDFTLLDQHGKLFFTQDYRGKYQLIYFGYSFCPDICPLGLQNISGALHALGRDLDDVIPVFVTIDPERDTVEALRIYATNFHSKFKMLTGTSEQITHLLKKYKVYAAKTRPDGTSADYLMDHSTLIYLLNREGKYIKSYSHTTPSGELAQSIIHILAQDMKTVKKIPRTDS